MYIRSFMGFNYWVKRHVFHTKAKTVYVIENNIPHPSGLKYNQTAAINAMKSDCVFGLTDSNILNAKKLYSRDDIRKTRVGVDLSVFYQKSCYELSNKPKIICVGTLTNRKRPWAFVNLAAEFPDLDFIWYGDGDQRKSIEERIAKSKLSNCRFIGNQPHVVIAEKLREADIFYFPSLHEGFGKATIEAMACGLPTIVHDDYKPEHIESGIDGFIVSTDSEARMRILELLGSTEMRKKIGRNGRKKSELYSWDDIAKGWMDFFTQEQQS